LQAGSISGRGYHDLPRVRRNCLANIQDEVGEHRFETVGIEPAHGPSFVPSPGFGIGIQPLLVTPQETEIFLVSLAYSNHSAATGTFLQNHPRPEFVKLYLIKGAVLEMLPALA
jgi:hypothetical protein